MLNINDIIVKDNKKLLINGKEVINNSGKGKNGAPSKLPDMLDLTLVYIEEDTAFKEFYLNMIKDMDSEDIPFHTKNSSPLKMYEYVKQVIDNFDSDKAFEVIKANDIKIDVNNAKYLVKSDEDTLAKTYLTEDMEYFIPFIILSKLIWLVVLIYAKYAHVPVQKPLALDRFVGNIARKLSLYTPFSESVAYQRLVKYVKSHIKDQGGISALRYRAEIYSSTTNEVIDLFVPATAIGAIFKSVIPMQPNTDNNALSSILEECKKSNEKYQAPIIKGGDEASGWTSGFEVSTDSRVGESAYIDIDLNSPRKIYDKLSSFNGKTPTEEDYVELEKASKIIITNEPFLPTYIQVELLRKCLVLVSRCDALTLASIESMNNFKVAAFYWLSSNDIKNIGELILGVTSQFTDEDCISSDIQLDKISRDNDAKLTTITKHSKNKDKIKSAINALSPSIFTSVKSIIKTNDSYTVDFIPDSNSFRNDFVDFLIFCEEALIARNKHLKELLELDKCYNDF